jgi:hypothetical protein
MRSGEQVLFEAAVRRGAARGVVAAYAEALRPGFETVRRVGIPASEAAANLVAAGRMFQRASRRRHLRAV